MFTASAGAVWNRSCRRTDLAGEREHPVRGLRHQPEWGAVGRDNVELFFNRLPAGASSHPRIRALGAYDAYFRVSGVDQLAAEFRERGAVIREGPTNRVYDVREIVIEDLNGLVLAFGEPIARRATAEDE
jgi:hypothetical protein